MAVVVQRVTSSLKTYTTTRMESRAIPSLGLLVFLVV